jgi:hypothetical protein
MHDFENSLLTKNVFQLVWLTSSKLQLFNPFWKRCAGSKHCLVNVLFSPIILQKMAHLEIESDFLWLPNFQFETLSAQSLQQKHLGFQSTDQELHVRLTLVCGVKLKEQIVRTSLLLQEQIVSTSLLFLRHCAQFQK